MGTARTAEQIARAWRVVYAPVLLMDGDPAGRKAAVRACETALPGLGPGGTLSIAILPDGVDPDDLLRRPVEEGCARERLDAVLSAAVPCSHYLWDAALAMPWAAKPEGKAALGRRLPTWAAALLTWATRGE